MDLNWKAKWLKALRSGKYKQTDCVLRRGGNKKKATFCCFGVLCDVAGAKWEKSYKNFDAYKCSFGDHTLSPSSLELFGIASVQQRKLIVMNDIENNSFNEIADYIEKRL